METNKKLKEIFIDLFHINESTELSEINIGKIESWDSLNHLSLIISIESRFGVDIPPDDFPSLHSDFKSIRDYIDEKLNNKN